MEIEGKVNQGEGSKFEVGVVYRRVIWVLRERCWHPETSSGQVRQLNTHAQGG